MALGDAPGESYLCAGLVVFFPDLDEGGVVLWLLVTYDGAIER